MPRNTRKIVTRSKVRFAPVEAVEDWAAEASAQMIICRDEGHKWKRYDVDGDSKNGFTRYYRCACKAMRVQMITATGYIVGSRIDYPKGYQMPEGTGRISRDGNAALRVASTQQDLARRNLKAARKAS